MGKIVEPACHHRPMHDAADRRAEVLERCRSALAGWADLTIDEVEFDPPKGFSSFTMGVRPKVAVDPPAVLYRHLAGKENAILDPEAERDVFLLLGEHDIAAHCWYVDDTCRIEAFHRGRTLTAADVRDPTVLRGIAAELHRFHRLEPDGLPESTFFELLHAKWGPMAQRVLTEHRTEFPPDERAMCDELLPMFDSETLAMVLRCLPDREPVFCHNDTYHGNVMLLDDGTIKLLDFEFSCRNHAAFDFANLFAETVMVHGLAEPPHFRIAEPAYTDADIAVLIGAYLDHGELDAPTRADELVQLLDETRRAIMLSDYMYAMAALPLALEPIQKIRFLPYAHQRFHRFLDTWRAEFDA
jgi:thiamine kinase-like enzyme